MKTRRRSGCYLGKPGLDGHDRGAKVVAHALKDAGMEVIYTGSSPDRAVHPEAGGAGRGGRHRTVDHVRGAHPDLQKLMGLLKEEQIQDVLVVVGGVIPNRDVPVLNEMGVQGVFPGGTRFDDIVGFIKENVTVSYSIEKEAFPRSYSIRKIVR